MPEKVSFFHGKEENVAQAIKDGKINGADFVVTSDTDNLIYINKEQVDGEDTFVPHILGNAKSKEAHIVNLGKDGTLGGFTTGDKLDVGTSLDDLIKKLLIKRVPASYDAPTVSIACPKAGSYEVGTPVPVGVTGVFTQKDAGALNKLQVLKNGASPAVLESAESPIVFSDEAFIVPDGDTTYQVVASYDEGAIKKDNLGSESPAGHILAGTIKSTISKITGFRKAFFGAGVGDPAIATSDNIRALGNSVNAPKKGTVFSISVPEGQQYAVFAYPSSVGEVSQVMYVETNDTGAKSKFELTKVNVNGAIAEDKAPEYNVYCYKMAIPASANMTFKVTL